MTVETDAPSDPSETPTEGGQDSESFEGSFEDLDLPEAIATGLKDLGYKTPTKVQHSVYATVRSGRDVIVQSRTGSGKTTAFCLPVHVDLDPKLEKVQAIVLCPTRELANQVATESSRIGHHNGTRVTAIYGGASMQAQIDALEAGSQFVVGRLGRVLDLLRRGHLKLKHVKYAILDEADEMLSMGFWEDVTSILNQLPSSKQTLLFSATLPPQIQRAAAKYLVDPERIDLSSDNINVSTIRHLYHTVDENLARPRNFLYLLEFHHPQTAIVFCNRRDETELVCRYLRRFGYRAEALNGDMPQSARERVLRKVKAGELNIMVATDVAARGIDISDLGHVFNYDLPEYDEVYVHRVGRTGRIGKKGTAVSLVRGKYLAHLTSITRDYEVPFEEIVLPDEKEIVWMQAERIAAQLAEEADGAKIDQYRSVAETMLDRGDAKELFAFLLRSHFSASRNPAPQRDEGERSESRGRDRDGGRGRGRDRDGGRGRGRDRDGGRGRGDRDGEAPADFSNEDDEEVTAPGRGQNSGEGRPAEPEADSNIANLYVTLGRADGLEDMRALVAKLSEMSGVDDGHFTGAGDVRDHSSHIEVDKEVAEKIVEAVHGKPRDDDEEASDDDEDDDRGPRTIVCEPARPKRSRRAPPRRRGRR